MALTKAEMAEALFNQLGLNKREARELVDLFFEEVRLALSQGEQVKLSGFGNFDLRDKNQVFQGMLAAVRTNAGISWHNQADDEEVEVVRVSTIIIKTNRTLPYL